MFFYWECALPCRCSSGIVQLNRSTCALPCAWSPELLALALPCPLPCRWKTPLALADYDNAMHNWTALLAHCPVDERHIEHWQTIIMHCTIEPLYSHIALWMEDTLSFGRQLKCIPQLNRSTRTLPCGWKTPWTLADSYNAFHDWTALLAHCPVDGRHLELWQTIMVVFTSWASVVGFWTVGIVCMNWIRSKLLFHRSALLFPRSVQVPKIMHCTIEPLYFYIALWMEDTLRFDRQ